MNFHNNLKYINQKFIFHSIQHIAHLSLKWEQNWGGVFCISLVGKYNVLKQNISWKCFKTELVKHYIISKARTRLGKLKGSGVGDWRLSASWVLFTAPLKPLKRHDTMVPRGLGGAPYPLTQLKRHDTMVPRGLRGAPYPLTQLKRHYTMVLRGLRGPTLHLSDSRCNCFQSSSGRWKH